MAEADTAGDIAERWREFTAALAAEMLMPTHLIISQQAHGLFTVLLKADEQHWNWRRTKLELRKLSLRYRGPKSRLAGKPANRVITDGLD